MNVESESTSRYANQYHIGLININLNKSDAF